MHDPQILPNCITLHSDDEEIVSTSGPESVSDSKSIVIPLFGANRTNIHGESKSMVPTNRTNRVNTADAVLRIEAQASADCAWTSVIEPKQLLSHRYIHICIQRYIHTY